MHSAESRLNRISSPGAPAPGQQTPVPEIHEPGWPRSRLRNLRLSVRRQSVCVRWTAFRAQGLISDAEYAEKRKQILREF